MRSGEIDAKLLAIERVFGSYEVHRQLVMSDHFPRRGHDALGVRSVVLVGFDI